MVRIKGAERYGPAMKNLDKALYDMTKAKDTCELGNAYHRAMDGLSAVYKAFITQMCLGYAVGPPNLKRIPRTARVYRGNVIDAVERYVHDFPEGPYYEDSVVYGVRRVDALKLADHEDTCYYWVTSEAIPGEDIVEIGTLPEILPWVNTWTGRAEDGI